MKKQLLVILFISYVTSLLSQTAISAPSTQASNISISNVSATSMRIDWMSGSGQYEIVVMRQATTPNTLPSNSNMSTYTASAAYGNGSAIGLYGSVVYKGSGNTVTVTNLTPNTSYEVAVYSYNYGCLSYSGNNCTGGYGYMLNTTYSILNREARLTLAIEPFSAPTLSLIGIPSANTATIAFGGSSQGNLIYIYDKSVATNHNPIDGIYYNASTAYGVGDQVGGTTTSNYAVYSGTPNGVINISNLPPATAFYAIAQSYNGMNSISYNCSFNYLNNSASVFFSTLNSPPTLNPISNYTVCQNSPPTAINLSGISKGTNLSENQTVNITATSSNTLLIPNPIINYLNPNSTGTLTFKPNSGLFGSSVITVRVSDGGPNNSITIQTFTVYVNGIPEPAGIISSSKSKLCRLDNNVTFYVPDIINASNYIWILPPGATIINGLYTNTITANFNVNTSLANISVHGTNNYGCGIGSASNLTLNFDELPTASNAGTDQIICNNLTQLAANQPLIGTGSWTWCTFGLGNISDINLPNANLQIANNQTISAVWTVTNGVCPPSSSTVNIANINGAVNCSPYADFVSNGTVACLNGVVTFSNTSIAAIGANTYTWNFGSGAVPSTTITSLPVVSVTYTTLGFKTVSLSMNGGAGALTNTKNNYLNIISTPNTPGIISGNSTVCQGKSGEPYFITPVSNANGYNWSFPAGCSQNTGGGTNNISINYSDTASSGNISVSAYNTCGTSSMSILPISINELPTGAMSILGPTLVCQGTSSVAYIATNINNGISYTWSMPNGCNITSGINTSSITVNYNNNATSGLLSVYGTNVCGNGKPKTIGLVVNTLPGSGGIITGNNVNSICPLSTSINYSIDPIPDAISYHWSFPNGYNIAGGANTNSINLDASVSAISGTIKVVGINSCGAGDTSSVMNVNTVGLPSHQICMVTVDESSSHNEVVWQKNGVSNIDSFRVYRVQTLLQDTLISTVAYSDLSKITDLTANPNVTSYTYKISALDSCGNEGPKSLPHQSIHLQCIYSPSPQKMDLSWNLYSGAPVLNYRVLRDTNNSGTWTPIINNLAPNATSFTDYSIPSGAYSVQYRVDVVWFNSCDPTQRISQSIVNTTKSNTKDFIIALPTNIKTVDEIMREMTIQPNPVLNMVSVNFKTGLPKIEVRIFDQIGNLIEFEQGINVEKLTLDIEGLDSGLYLIEVKTEYGIVTKRIIKL